MKQHDQNESGSLTEREENDPAFGRRMSRSKRWIFILATGITPVILLGLLEVGLRIGGYGENYPLFVPFENNPAYLHLNPEVAKRFFPSDAVIPNGNLDLFQAVKTDSTLRIVVLGGSSAAGYPFYRGGSFPRILRRALVRSSANREIEVVNVSMATINSFALIDFVPEVLAIHPDAVLIYAGHNEYYGAMGVGSAQSGIGSGWINRLYLRVRDLRIVQLVRTAISGVAGLVSTSKQPSRTMMERMVGEQTIAFESPQYEAGVRQFSENLSRILASFQRENIPVFLGTLVSNEHDHAPFVSVYKGGTDESVYNQTAEDIRSLLETKSDLALVEAKRLVERDSLAALGHFLLAKALETGNEIDRKESRSRFNRAKDYDALRFRAPSEFNKVIRERARQFGATVVDVLGAFQKVAPTGVPGDESMTEHLHPNIAGYRIMARAFLSSLADAEMFGLSRDDSVRIQPSDLVLSEADSAVAAFRVLTLTSRWPFKPKGTLEAPLLPDSNSEAEELAERLYREETGWYEGHLELFRLYLRERDFSRALEINNALLDEFPIFPDLWFDRATTAWALRDTREIERSLRSAARFASADVMADFHNRLANQMVREGETASALHHFAMSIDLHPTAAALKMTGSLWLQESQSTGDVAERLAALDALERAIQLEPDDIQARYNLAGAYALNGDRDKAILQIENILGRQPGHNGALELRRQILGN